MSEINYRSPIYLQLREVVRTKIIEGEYPPGTAIPSENELAESYGINHLTVRNAIDALVYEGLLKRVQSKGVYVMGRKVERDLETLGGFAQTMRAKNLHTFTKIRAKVLRKAGDKFSLVFGIEPDDDVYYIKRFCYADDEPFSMEEIFIPYSVVPKLEGIDLTVFSFYEVYSFYGIRLARAEQTLDLARLDRKDARTLGISDDMAVMLFECTSYDEKGRVIEFARNYTRGDKCNFSVSFRK
jgi:GntR family transcriptional regulator